jgi:hypothetical protein
VAEEEEEEEEDDDDDDDDDDAQSFSKLDSHSPTQTPVESS